MNQSEVRTSLTAVDDVHELATMIAELAEGVKRRRDVPVSAQISIQRIEVLARIVVDMADCMASHGTQTHTVIVQEAA